MRVTLKGVLALIITTSALTLFNLLAVKASGQGLISTHDILLSDKSTGIKLSATSLANSTTEPKRIETPVAHTQQDHTAIDEPAIMTSDQVRQRVCEVFGSQCKNALIIAAHESGFNPKAVSPTNDYGVMQVNCTWHAVKVGGDCTRLFDVETNLRVAKQIYDSSGWKAWATAKYL